MRGTVVTGIEPRPRDEVETARCEQEGANAEKHRLHRWMLDFPASNPDTELRELNERSEHWLNNLSASRVIRLANKAKQYPWLTKGFALYWFMGVAYDPLNAKPCWSNPQVFHHRKTDPRPKRVMSGNDYVSLNNPEMVRGLCARVIELLQPLLDADLLGPPRMLRVASQHDPNREVMALEFAWLAPQVADTKQAQVFGKEAWQSIVRSGGDPHEQGRLFHGTHIKNLYPVATTGGLQCGSIREGIPEEFFHETHCGRERIIYASRDLDVGSKAWWYATKCRLLDSSDEGQLSELALCRAAEVQNLPCVQPIFVCRAFTPELDLGSARSRRTEAVYRPEAIRIDHLLMVMGNEISDRSDRIGVYQVQRDVALKELLAEVKTEPPPHDFAIRLDQNGKPVDEVALKRVSPRLRVMVHSDNLQGFPIEY